MKTLLKSEEKSKIKWAFKLITAGSTFSGGCGIFGLLINLSLAFGDLHFKLKNQGIPWLFSSRDCLDQELSKLGIVSESSQGLSKQISSWLLDRPLFWPRWYLKKTISKP